MVKIARPSRIINIFDTLEVYFTACSILDGELTLWGQLLDIDDLDGSAYAHLDEKIRRQVAKNELIKSPAEIKPDEHYLIRYNLDGKWYRGKVMNAVTGKKVEKLPSDNSSFIFQTAAFSNTEYNMSTLVMSTSSIA